MSKVAIHQLHYFPWLGYLDKMAKADKFILLDEVQLEKGSNMYRNKVSTWDGKEKYLTVCYKKQDCLNKPFREILLENSVDWQDSQREFIFQNYRKALFFNEVWSEIEHIFLKEYKYLMDVLMDSIEAERKLFDIRTEIILQSDIKYLRDTYKNEMLIELCKAVNADVYLSGNGARGYMAVQEFEAQGITVEYQKFEYPKYQQFGEFVPNLSALDILFHCGKREGKRIFWNNVKN